MPQPSLTIRQYLLGAGLSLAVALLLLGLMPRPWCAWD
jgi:hypothetical protein